MYSFLSGCFHTTWLFLGPFWLCVSEVHSFLLLITSPLYGYITIYLSTCCWTFGSFFFFFFFMAASATYEVPRQGFESELQLQPTPQPWQHWIWATSVTYATICGNTGSLPHWVRPGIEPASSQRNSHLDHFKFFYEFYFFHCSWLTEFWEFLLSSKLTQSYIYIDR